MKALAKKLKKEGNTSGIMKFSTIEQQVRLLCGVGLKRFAPARIPVIGEDANWDPLVDDDDSMSTRVDKGSDVLIVLYFLAYGPPRLRLIIDSDELHDDWNIVEMG